MGMGAPIGYGWLGRDRVDGGHVGERVGVGWKMGGADAPTSGRGVRYKTLPGVVQKSNLNTTHHVYKNYPQNYVTYDMFHAILESTKTKEAPTTCL